MWNANKGLRELGLIPQFMGVLQIKINIMEAGLVIIPKWTIHRSDLLTTTDLNQSLGMYHATVAKKIKMVGTSERNTLRKITSKLFNPQTFAMMVIGLKSLIVSATRHVMGVGTMMIQRLMTTALLAMAMTCLCQFMTMAPDTVSPGMNILATLRQALALTGTPTTLKDANAMNLVTHVVSMMTLLLMMTALLAQKDLLWRLFTKMALDTA